MLEVAQVHMRALFDNYFEVGVLFREESTRYIFHSPCDGGSAHHQLLLDSLSLAVGQMLLHKLTNTIFFAGVEEGVEFINHHRAQIADKQLIAISPMLKTIERGNGTIDALGKFAALDLMTLP